MVRELFKDKTRACAGQQFEGFTLNVVDNTNTVIIETFQKNI